MSYEPVHHKETNSFDSYALNYYPVVCAIVDNNIFCGTGFLIAPDLIITNYHVYKKIKTELRDPTLAKCKCSFMGDVENAWRDVSLHSEWDWLGVSKLGSTFSSVNPLDYIIFRLDQEVAKDDVVERRGTPQRFRSMTKRSWICLFDEKAVTGVKKGEEIGVTHHPSQSQEFEAVPSQVNRLDGPKIYYYFDPLNGTKDGSSGSLCFSAQNGRVVALHQAHESINFSGTREEKVGISIVSIIEDLKRRLPPDKLNHLKILPPLVRSFSVPEDPYKERVQELVDLLESLISNVSDEQRYIAYLLALPSGIVPQNNSLFGIVSHLDGLKTGRYSVLDFLVILEKLYEKNKLDLIGNEQIRKWIEKALDEKEKINDLLSLSRAYAEEYLKKRTINICVDIDQDNASTNVYTPKVYLELMGKPRVCISDTQEFSEIRSRKEFIRKFEIFWSRKINKLIYELEPQIVRIDFGVNQDTLDWDVGRSTLHSGSSSFRIGEKYPYIYRSLERLAFAPHKEALKDNLNSQYEALMFFGIEEKIPALSKDKSKGHFQNIFYTGIVRDRKIVCIYSFSFKKLPKSLRRIVYNGILNLGIPVFIWCISEDEIFDIAPFQVINSLDEFRNWLATVQMNDRQYFDVLFDDPQYLLKFKDEGDSHV